MKKNSSPEGLEAMRHTAAHILAAASRNLRPETRLGVGPATEDGFFHDIDVDQNYTESDLALLQEEMEKIKKMDLPIEQRDVSKAEAREMFKNDPFKLELIDSIEGENVGISDMGNGFFDLVWPAKHVPVVLGNAAHARQSLQFARLFIAVHCCALGVAYRQFFITAFL